MAVPPRSMPATRRFMPPILPPCRTARRVAVNSAAPEVLMSAQGAAGRILVIVGDGGESYETWFAVHRFLEAGFETRVAAPSKKRLHLVMHDFEPGWDTYVERPGYAMDSDLTFA